MKKLLLSSFFLVLAVSLHSQTGKHAYFSTKYRIKNPPKGQEEWVSKESKITVDYDLKIIKVNLGDEEGIYSFSKSETEDIGGIRTTIDIDKGHAFSMLMIFIEKKDSFIALSPDDDEKQLSLLFADIKVLY